MRRIINNFRAISFLCVIFLSFSAFSNGFNKDKIINEAIKSISNLKSVVIEFEQKDNNQQKVNGALLIQRPNNFRCNYFPPYPLLITGNKNFITIYDYDLEQITYLDPEDTFINILINIENWHKGFTIQEVKENQNIITIKLKDKTFDKEIILSLKNNQLSKLEIIEDTNSHILINFNKITHVKSFEKDLFSIKNPNIFGAPQHYNKSEIMKKIK